jgi:AraC-like DNA-binding protein
MAKHGDIHATVLNADFFRGPAHRVLSRRRRTAAAQIIVVVSGVYKATYDTPGGLRSLRAEAGDVVFWPAGSEDTDESEPGRPLHCIAIYLRWPGAPANLPRLARDTEHVFDLLARRLLAAVHSPARKAGLGAVADAYLNAMLAELITVAKAAADNTLAARVMRYTEEHIQDPIRLADLARCAGLEKHHFARKYKQLTGRTPMQDVRRRKADHARRSLLLAPHHTLATVAPLVGVRDRTTLSRLLRRDAGVSARDIRKAARAKR